MSHNNGVLAGIGIGILITLLVTKLFDASWILASVGVLFLVIAGTGVLSKK